MTQLFFLWDFRQTSESKRSAFAFQKLLFRIFLIFFREREFILKNFVCRSANMFCNDNEKWFIFVDICQASLMMNISSCESFTG